MGKWLDAAKPVRSTMNKAGTLLDDREASSCVSLYPMMQFKGELIAAGTRINWNGQIKRAAVDLWDTYENSPDAAPSLWSSIAYKDGERIIPLTITADLAFAKGELGWWADTLYESQLDANVWTPDDYPAGWMEVLNNAADENA